MKKAVRASAEKLAPAVEFRVMETVTFESIDAGFNPLDSVEELVAANQWTFDRVTDTQMVVDIQGRWCDYRLFFMWNEENSGMQFACQFDMKVPDARRPALNELLVSMNERLWLGHFDICSTEHTPLFRYTMLLRGVPMVSLEQLEDLVEIALSECERYFPAVQFVIWGGKTAEEAIAAAVLDTVGEA